MDFNFTKIPNGYLDQLMNSLTGSEFKILMAISRKTLGFHKTVDKISISQFIEMTGLSNRSVIDSIRSLETKRIIHVSRTKRQPTEFKLNVAMFTGEKSSQDQNTDMKKNHNSGEHISQAAYEKTSHTKETEKKKEIKVNPKMETQETREKSQIASEYLYRKISDKKKDYKVPEPHWNKWQKEFGEMLIQYDCSLDLVKDIIDWSQQNEFWCSKTLTPKDISKHFIKLATQMKADHQFFSNRTNHKLKGIPGTQQA